MKMKILGIKIKFDEAAGNTALAASILLLAAIVATHDGKSNYTDKSQTKGSAPSRDMSVCLDNADKAANDIGLNVNSLQQEIPTHPIIVARNLCLTR